VNPPTQRVFLHQRTFERWRMPLPGLKLRVALDQRPPKGAKHLLKARHFVLRINLTAAAVVLY
jgi:hypothetical protein